MKKHFTIISTGLCYASVCTNLPIEEAVEQMNMEAPTGISSRWALSEDATFADRKTPNGAPCEQSDVPGARHYLLNC